MNSTSTQTQTVEIPEDGATILRKYDFNDVPTVRKFVLDYRRITAIQGPFGCLSGDTEHLTLSGWKRMDSYQPGRLIAEFDPKTKAISFQEPTQYIKEPCGTFLHFKNQYGIDQLLSDEHTVLFNTRFKPGEWRTMLAGEIAEQHNRLKDGWSGRIPTTFRAPVVEGVDLEDSEIRLMTAISADGHFSSNTNKCYVCVRKERKKQRLRWLLSTSNIGWEERNHATRPTETIFVFNAPQRNKFLWRYIDANEHQLAVIADEFVHWDGCLDCYGGRIFSSTVKENADFIQYTLATTGVRSTIAEVEYDNDKWQKGYRLYAGTGTTEVSLRNAPKIKRVPSEDGFKYCFTTQTGFFVARRNGRIFITGNSGKSSGCLMKIIKLAHEQKPGPDGWRRSRWAVVRNTYRQLCYDDQTEILTEKRGWQLFKNLTPADKVASLVNGEELVFMTPTSYYQAPCAGEMIEFENEGVSFCVTPNHSLYVSLRNARRKEWSAYRMRSAQDVYGKRNMRVKRDAMWRGQKSNYPMAFFEWLGFFVAEGSSGIYGSNRQCVIIQKDNIEYVRTLFKEAGVIFTDTKRNDGVTVFRVSYKNDDALFQLLLSLGKAHQKHVPQFVKDATPEEIGRFIKGYLAGDGGHGKGGTVTAVSSSKQLVDDLQELAIRCGMVANLYKVGPATKDLCINGVTSKQNHQIYQISFLTNGRRHPMLDLGRSEKYPNQYPGWSKKQYDGIVYCVEVPSHVILVRKSNKYMWSSNSDTTMKTVFQWLPKTLCGTYVERDKTYYVDQFYEDRVMLEMPFRALDDEEDVRNLLSLELTGAWLNEYREIRKSIFEALDGRIGRFPSKQEGGCTWEGIIMDSNPPRERSYWFNYFEKKRPQNARLWKQPSGLSVKAENVRNLPRNYYLNLAMGKDDQFVNVYVHGRYGFLIEGRSVYHGVWNDNFHVASVEMEPNPELPVLLGFDFALSPACVIGQMMTNGQLRIYNELMGQGMGIKRFINDHLLPLLKAKYYKCKTFIGAGDPSGKTRADTDERSCYDELWDAGFTQIQEAPTNAMVPRITAVEYFLTRVIDGEPAFVISPDCEMLREGFNGGYRFKKIPHTEEYTDQPEKNQWSHIADATQYLCLYVANLTAIEDKRGVVIAMASRRHMAEVGRAGY